jgi:predicted permease
MLGKRPLFTAVAVGTFGLGIGSFTAMYSVLRQVVLYPSPFPDPDRLVTVFLADPGLQDAEGTGSYWDRNPLQLTQARDLREHSTRFKDVGIHRTWEMTLSGLGEPRREMVGVAGASLFQTLGLSFPLGRPFLPEEEGFTQGTGAQVAIISHEMWRTRYSADPLAVGREITLDYRPFTIIGILPEDFRLRWLGLPGTGGLDTGNKQIWVPIGSHGGNPSGGSWEVIGRLRPGVSLGQATDEAEGILLGDVAGREGRRVRILPRKEADTGKLRPPLFLLFAATGVLLLLACLNVTAVFLGETASRDREIVTRVALGAGRWRIAQQSLAETMGLGGLGAVLGAVIAWGAVRALVGSAPPTPGLDKAGIDPSVLVFSVTAGILTGLLAGALAVGLARGLDDLSSRLSGRTNTLLQGGLKRILLPAQVSLTMVLLVLAGLLVRSQHRLNAVDVGFRAAGLTSVHLTLPPSEREGDDESLDFREASR